MTVSYSKQVATSSNAACFLRLLLRWQGSIYKLLWKDFALFAFVYYLLFFIYRFALSGYAKMLFEYIAKYCQEFSNLIPVAFVLGFYVSLVVSRFWEQFRSIPWPSRMALFVSALLQGNDTRGRLMRRSIMRYMCLAYVLTTSSISPPVKKRFPTLQHITDAGILLPNEQKVLEGLNTKFNTYFVPLIWAASIVSRARKEGRIKDDFAVKTLIDEINEYRGKCGSLFSYDWVTVPLVYTQVVTIAVYTFFLSCLMGRQPIDFGGEEISEMYFPFFTFLQFLFYMGWLKVAETLLNPFGEDDDDFDINGLIDSNLQSSYLIVDDMHQEHPELIKDQYWDTVAIDLPYTQASQQYQKSEHHLGSAVSIKIPASQAQFVSGSVAKGSSMPKIPEEAEDGDNDSSKLLSLKSHQKSSDSIDERKTSRTDLTRSTSKLGSLRNLVSSSFQWMNRRGRRTEAEDVESGLASVPEKNLLELKQKYQGKRRKTKDRIHDDMIFEMSDDESVCSKHSTALVGGASNEHLATKTSSEHPKTLAEHTVGQSFHSSKAPSVASESVKIEGNFGTMNSNQAQFVDELRDQLRELREAIEAPKDSHVPKVDQCLATSP